MKLRRTALSLILVLTTMAPAVAAETPERNESLPDAYPECMQINGPDCVLKSQFAPPRVAAPQAALGSPGVVVVPAPTSSVTTVPEITTVITPPPAQRPTIISPRP